MTQVSVILPNYNYAHYLPQRIESILNQTFTDFELIILDDCSTDNSKDIIEKYIKSDKRISVFYNEKNSGNPFVQWKKGIEYSKADLIWIAEADDYCNLTFLEKLLPILENKNVGICYCKSKIVDENENEIDTTQSILNNPKFENSFSETGKNFIDNYLINYNFIPNASGVIFRKDIYNSVGGVDVNIKNCADWLLWLKMLFFCDISYNSEPLNYFRRHENSVIGKISSDSQPEIFKEIHSKTMRQFFNKWLEYNKLNLSKPAKFTNNYEISLDIGNFGLFCMKNKMYIKGLKNVLHSSFFPKPKSGYLKKMVK